MLFTIRQPEGKPRQAGVRFAVKSTLVSKLQEHHKGPHLLYMKLELSHGHTVVLLSAYVPTMDATDQDKEAFSILQQPKRHPSVRHVRKTRICDCRMFGTLPHFPHTLAKCAYSIFFPHILAFSAVPGALTTMWVNRPL